MLVFYEDCIKKIRIVTVGHLSDLEFLEEGLKLPRELRLHPVQLKWSLREVEGLEEEGE